MTASPWPPALVGTPAVAVIERAIASGRLGHSLLLEGEDLEILAGAAAAIADRVLNREAAGSGTVRFAPDKHPDCFVLRPAKKMRQISAAATRELIGQVQVSAAVGSQKVAIIHEAERMHIAAANIFLKTLEEPPANTLILLLTTHPYSLLPTIRSRCLHFRFPSKFDGTLSGGLSGKGLAETESLAKTDPTTTGTDPFDQPEPVEPPLNPALLWQTWLQDYRAWLTRLATAATDKAALADHIFSIYGLVARFQLLLDAAAAEAWEEEKASLPPNLEDDERIAAETGLVNRLRLRLLAEIEGATLGFARPRLEAGDEATRRAFTAAIATLERDARLLVLNLNESAVLEDFLLSSLRLWTKRG